MLTGSPDRLLANPQELRAAQVAYVTKKSTSVEHVASLQPNVRVAVFNMSLLRDSPQACEIFLGLIVNAVLGNDKWILCTATVSNVFLVAALEQHTNKLEALQRDTVCAVQGELWLPAWVAEVFSPPTRPWSPVQPVVVLMRTPPDAGTGAYLEALALLLRAFGSDLVQHVIQSTKHAFIAMPASMANVPDAALTQHRLLRVVCQGARLWFTVRLMDEATTMAEDDFAHHFTVNSLGAGEKVDIQYQRVDKAGVYFELVVTPSSDRCVEVSVVGGVFEVCLELLHGVSRAELFYIGGPIVDGDSLVVASPSGTNDEEHRSEDERLRDENRAYLASVEHEMLASLVTPSFLSGNIEDMELDTLTFPVDALVTDLVDRALFPQQAQLAVNNSSGLGSLIPFMCGASWIKPHVLVAHDGHMYLMARGPGVLRHVLLVNACNKMVLLVVTSHGTYRVKFDPSKDVIERDANMGITHRWSPLSFGVAPFCKDIAPFMFDTVDNFCRFSDRLYCHLPSGFRLTNAPPPLFPQAPGTLPNLVVDIPDAALTALEKFEQRIRLFDTRFGIDDDDDDDEATREAEAAAARADDDDMLMAMDFSDVLDLACDDGEMESSAVCFVGNWF